VLPLGYHTDGSAVRGVDSYPEPSWVLQSGQGHLTARKQLASASASSPEAH